MKKVIVIAIALIVVLVIAVLGYGFYNGSKIKTYAGEVKSIMENSNSKWNYQKIQEGDFDDESMMRQMETVKKDSQEQLSKLDKLNAPKSAGSLGRKAKEYFAIASDASEKILAVLNYSKALDDSQELMKNWPNGPYRNDEYVKPFTDWRKKMSKVVKVLDAPSVPAKYKQKNRAYVQSLRDFDKPLSRAIEVGRKQQMGMVNMDALFKELFQALQNVYNQARDNGIDTPDITEESSKLVSESDAAKLKNYPSELKSEADSLVKKALVY